MHLLRTHFSLVPPTLFLAGLAAVALPLFRGSLGPWQAAELSVYGALLAAVVYLARNLVRLRREVWSWRMSIDGQGLECGELAADDREEVEARMDELLERLSHAAGFLSRTHGPGHEGPREEVPEPQRPTEAERAGEGVLTPVRDSGAEPVVRTEAAGAAT
ncbi:hypothetical protein [Nocardiopsis kunsanensis]|uniref:hypothetical protein n=1 Tax=Nocardiopsis kunsanensis TaxID=141693 RepID=UPI00126868A2|nr:hypothetical protein [Nocardiopsis kunsanensis]